MLGIEPSRRNLMVNHLGVAVGGIVVLLWCLAHVDDEAAGPRSLDSSKVDVAADVVTVLVALFLLATLYYGRLWRFGLKVERLSNTPTVNSLLRAKQRVTSLNRAPSVPVLHVDPWRPRLWDRLPGLRRRRFHRVHHDAGQDYTAARNVTGDPPLEIGYLRVFENNARAKSLVQGAWREFGRVHLLRSAAAVPRAEFRRWRRNGVERMFVDSGEHFDAELRSQRRSPVLRPGWHIVRNVSPYTIRIWDRYGAFPLIAPLCHGSYWQEAVDELLLRVDLVVFDLSGLRKRNAGTSFELQRIVDRFPIERVVFLADPRSNLPYLETLLLDAWAKMAAGSPNAGLGSRHTLLARTDRFLTLIDYDNRGHETNRQTRLIARRWQTRSLAACLQSKLAEAPTPPREPWTNVVADTPVSLPDGPIKVPSRSELGPLIVLRGVLLATVVSLMGIPLVAGAATSPTPLPNAFPNVQPPTETPPLPTKVRPSRTPTTNSAKKPTRIKVPDIIGMRLEEAEHTLRMVKLKLGDTTWEPSDQAAGTVIAANPEPGKNTKKGNPVDVTLAGCTKVIPDVVGKPQSEAQGLLRADGFEIQVVLVPAPDNGTVNETGVVVETRPDAGTVPEQLCSPVTLLVSEAPTSTKPPEPPTTRTAEPSP